MAHGPSLQQQKPGARASRHPTWAALITWLLVLTYAGFFSWQSVTRHQAHRTDAYDMGNVNQAMWNTVNGRPLHFTNWRGVELSLASDNRLSMHVEPIYFLIAPLYWLWQQPELLLIVQAVTLALGALPVFWLATERLRIAYAGVIFAAAYLLFPGLQAANLWEFHAVALAAPLLLFTFYYGHSRRWGLMWLFAVLALSTKEEIPLTVALIGTWLAVRGAVRSRQAHLSDSSGATTRLERIKLSWRRPDVRHGLVLATAAMAWFALAVLLIIPCYGGGRSPYLGYFDYLFSSGSGTQPAGTLRSLGLSSQVLSAANLSYLVDLFTPVAYLSLFSPTTAVFSLPDLAINLLSDHEPMHFVQKYHYVAPLIPGVMISSILGTGWLARKVSAGHRKGFRACVLVLASAVLGATLFYHYYHGYTPLARAYEAYHVTDHHRLGRSIGQDIPVEASVSAQRSLNPQVSGRRTLYRFPYVGDADFVLLDLSTLANEYSLYRVAEDLLGSKEFGLVRAEDGYVLLQRGAEDLAGLADEFRTFATVTVTPNTTVPIVYQYPVDVAYSGDLHLIGFSVFDGRRTEMPQTPLRFVLYWKPTKPIKNELKFGLYLLDRHGNVIGGPDFQREPGILAAWHPTPYWRVGDVIRMEIRNMPWWTAQYDSYGVALGVMSGDDPWNVSARLAPQVLEGDLLLPYADDKTLVELIGFRSDIGGMPKRDETMRQRQPPKNMIRSDATWTNGVKLLGFTGGEQGSPSGASTHITLYWLADRVLEADYTVFVHLLGEDGTLCGQHDSQPVNNRLPTTRWRPGQIIEDRHDLVLTSELPQGGCSIQVGLYDASSGRRESLATGGDSVSLDRRIAR